MLELDVPMWDRLRRPDDWTAEQSRVFEAMREKVEAGGAGFGLLMAAPQHAGGPLRVRHHVLGQGGYTRRDYTSSLPQLEWARGLHDTLIEPARLRQGGPWQEHQTPGGLDYHVCTHGTVDAACGRFGIPVYQALLSGGERAWRTGHFGGHRFAATAVELPSGLLWAHLSPDLALRVARRKVAPAEVRGHLRGFAGLPPLAQVLDRELLVLHGWSWLEAQRHAHVDGETVELHYRWNGRRGTVRATVREGEPLHLPESSHKDHLGRMRQYRLSDLQTTEQAPR